MPSDGTGLGAGTGNSFYGKTTSSRWKGVPVAPVCVNCGASDFVWVNDIKTGSIGGGTLSLRSRGELALGTRICRSCGHADLFLKDPTILRMPHTWRPGEFVPIPARAPSPPANHPPAAPTPAPASPRAATAPPSPPIPTGPAPPPPPPEMKPAAPSPSPPAPPTLAPASPSPSPTEATAPVAEAGPGPSPAGKRPARRRTSKAK
jgi:hypothetical protein